MISASPSPLTSPAAATEGPGRNLRLNVAGLRRVKATPVIWKPPPAGSGSVSIRPLEVRPNTTSTRPMLPPWFGSNGKPDVARSPIPSPLTSPSNATRLPITLADEPAMRSVPGVVRSRVVATAALAAAGATAAVTATLTAAAAISRCRRLPGRGRSISMLHSVGVDPHPRPAGGSSSAGARGLGQGRLPLALDLHLLFVAGQSPAWPRRPHVCHGLAERSLKAQHQLGRRP